MPHLVIEHSTNIKKSSIKILETEVQNIMESVVEGNFDPDQCKTRSFSFDEYLVGKPDQSTSSFIHITIKILAGRTLEARQKLSEKTLNFAQKLFTDLNIATKRCDISVDIVEMDRQTYQKVRIGS
jgi:5-carboxymethyl-2-hydroxymuconate isomerase